MDGAFRCVAAVTLLSLTACEAPGDRNGLAAPEPARLGGESSLVGVFQGAGGDFGVPAELLATVAFVETRLRPAPADGPDHGGDHAGDHAGHAHGPVALGLMALSHGAPRAIDRAAALAGVAVEDAIESAAGNARAAAALLADLARADTGRLPVALRDWRPALEAFGDRRFADEVFARLSRGWTGLDAAGARLVCSAPAEFAPGVPTDPDGDRLGRYEQFLAGFPGAAFSAAHSSNYRAASRGSGSINYVVVHTMQGSYAGSISWFKNPSSNVSAHYMVRSSDGDITQMVDDSDIAWHVACFNNEAIGIEHEGFVDAPGRWYTDAMYTRSAELTAWLAEAYNIPVDRQHILGHGEAPDCSSHTDPGPGWNWNHYLDLVRSGGQRVFDAAFVGSEYPVELESGEEAVVWFEFENLSSFTWDLDATRLGTAEPLDRESAFFVPGNWLSPSRPTGADHSTYTPGTNGRFSFVIIAPEVDEPTEFTEYFRLIQEGEEWFGPVVSMTVTVVPQGGATPDPEPEPDPGDDEPDGPDAPGDPGDDGPRPPAPPDGGDGTDMEVSGGCRAAPDGGAGATPCAMLLLGAFLARRRRGSRRG